MLHESRSLAMRNQSTALSRSGPTQILTLLLIAQFVGIGLFLHHAFTQQSGAGLRIFALILTVFALLTIVGVWTQKPWALWATLILVSFKLTVDLYGWALDLYRPLILCSVAVNAAIVLLVFAQATPVSPRITLSQKVFFGCVMALAAWVGIWGMFIPLQVDMALPFKVPALHARFLGAMYLSGATFMLLGISARVWNEVRVVTPMISIWTGMLGIISLFHLQAFSWPRTQVWIWFFAYICYPLIAAWLAWRQRVQEEHSQGPPLSGALRTYLYIQGAVATILALALLLAPGAMTTVWPWKITPVLTHIYSAPFLSYGLGSIYAARQRTCADVRIVVYATLVFALFVLIGSYLHAQLFKFGTPSAWLWFGGFGLATLALALFGTMPALRRKI